VSFSVRLAETGAQAQEAIRSQAPDILLLDYKLPDMTGLDVLKQAAEAGGDMLTIMITAYASIETAVAATKQGAYDFLPKPFTPADLRHSVRKAAARIVLARQARKLAEEKRQVRFQFIRVLGHELKAPIAAVEGYVNILRDHTLGGDLSKYDTMLQRSSVRLSQMRKLIADLLDMTRIESGQKQRVLETVDLRGIAESAIELVSTEAAERGIVLALDAPDPVPIAGDRGELEMILNNLLSNAVKYNRDKGRVDVRLALEPSHCVVTVADTGIGMSKAETERLFGEFVRIKNPKTRNILGSGLGLSILKRLVELYDGDIAVQSEEDRGTTFTVRLKREMERL
jgi:two-component system, sensor histidine kinase and response regulator